MSAWPEELCIVTTMNIYFSHATLYDGSGTLASMGLRETS